MGEVTNFIPEVEESTQKEYWETGIDAHKFVGEKPNEDFRKIANKIDYLFNQGIIPQYNENGNDIRLQFIDEIRTNRQGFKSNQEKWHRKANEYILQLDKLQDWMKKSPDKLRTSQYQSIEDLVRDLQTINNPNSKKEDLERAQENFESLVYERTIYKKAA